MPKEKHKIISDLLPLKVPIKDFRVDPDNARTDHDIAGIAESLKEYGQRKPIVVNKTTGHIEAGNGTCAAAQASSWTHIAAVFVEDDSKTATGYSIADNRLGDLSVFDPEKLRELLNGLDEVDIPGVDDDFLEELGINLNEENQDFNIEDFLSDEDKEEKEPEQKTFTCEHCGKESKIS